MGVTVRRIPRPSKVTPTPVPPQKRRPGQPQPLSNPWPLRRRPQRQAHWTPATDLPDLPLVVPPRKP